MKGLRANMACESRASNAPLIVSRGDVGVGRRILRGLCHCSCATVHLCCIVLLDLATIGIILAVLPLLACVSVPVCLPAIVDYLLHPTREYLDGVSAVYISNLPEAVIHCVVIYEERVSAEAVFAQFKHVYLGGATPEFDKFRQVIVRPKWCWPYWAAGETSLDPAYHMTTVRESLTKDELQARVAAIQCEPLDFARPVWQVWHFENYTDERGRPCSATLVRLHHAWVDGLTGMRVLLKGASPNAPPDSPPSQRVRQRRGLSGSALVRYILATLRKLLLMPQDPPSGLKARRHLGPSSSRVVAWNTLPGVSVADLKQVGAQLGGASVNDLLCSALSSALRSYCQSSLLPRDRPRGDPTAAVWVSCAPLKHMYASFDEVPLVWGCGSLGVVYIPLPVGTRYGDVSPGETLHILRQRTSSPALELEAFVAHLLQSAIGALPRPVGGLVWRLVANTVTVSMSNLPGPQFPLRWCGAPVRSMLFFVPPTGTLSLFVTIATWNGAVNIGMAMDAALLGHEKLSDITGRYFEDEIAALRSYARDPSLGRVV